MKSKVMSLLALASCVMLSGCGEDKKEVKIEIADFPTNLVEGDSIDLKDYIVVSGGVGDYSINFDDASFAKIEQKSETEIEFLQYGTISFTVDYSGKTADGSIVVSSALLQKFLNDTADVGYDYTTFTIDYEGYLDSFVNYGEKFYADLWFEQSGEEDLPGGYLESMDGNVYSFYIDDEEQFVFSRTGFEPEEISDFSKKLDFPRTGYEILSEGSVIDDVCIRLDENENMDVARLCQDFFLYNLKAVEQYQLEVSAIEIYEDELTFSGTSYPVYFVCLMAYDRDPLSETYNEEVLLGYQLLSVNEDLLFKDFIQDYIDNEEEPPASPYSLHNSDIKNAINNHNYTIDYDYGWYNASVDEDGERTRGSKLSSNPFASDLSKQGEYINEFLNATGEFNVYVGTDKTFSDVPHKDDYGLAKNPGDGNAYKYSGNSSDGYHAKENTGAPLYDEDYDFIYESYQFLKGDQIDEETPSIYEGIFINDRTRNGDDYAYSFSGVSAGALFRALFISTINDGDYPIEQEKAYDWTIGNYNTLNVVAQFLENEGMCRYLNATIVEKFEDSVLVGLRFEFVWEEDGEEEGDPYYDYVLSADINFKECVMPEFDVNFPEA